MGARVITVTSGKGGVGKTTATANLAVALALLDKKVVCIDADIGLRNLDVVMGLENRIVYDLVDVVEGRCKLRQAMVKDKRVPDLYLLPAAQTRDKTAVSPQDMVALTNQLRPDYDYILIDSPAGIEWGFRNALAPADEVVVVTNPEVSAVRDADRIVGLIEAEERKIPVSLVINRVKAAMVQRGDMLSVSDVMDILSIRLLGVIPEDENILVSSNKGSPLTLNNQTVMAGEAFRNIARRLTGEKVPLLKLEQKGGLLKRLSRLFGSSDSTA
ncbi:MAG TPA: septum site-determining protein MinD [Aggregatilineaceae bacterium]|nr:septum site-determining protein MinD [Aggregatilineaceae bacterium]